jgi:predicted transcriptional regulator of viral defense system
MKRSTRKAGRQLFATALEQGGYFTAKQAHQAGYAYSHLDYHVSCGNFVRVGHGLYRLPDLPPAEHDDLIRLTLWSRNRQDQPQAVVSHESALVLHELSELLPTKTHLIVPPGFRKKAPQGCVLHKEALPRADVEGRQGFQVTTPLRTLLDVTRGGIRQEQLAKAVADALGRGLVRQGRLASVVRADPALQRLAFVLGLEEAGVS